MSHFGELPDVTAIHFTNPHLCDISIYENIITIDHDFVKNVKSTGRSVIFIGHNIYHVFDICDRFIVLDRGEIVHQLDKSELESPESLIKIMRGAVIKHD